MVGVDELDLEAAEPDRITGADMVELDLLGHPVLGELGLDDAAGQTGRIDRRVAFAQNIRDRADVVLMAVRDDVAAQLVVLRLR